MIESSSFLIELSFDGLCSGEIRRREENVDGGGGFIL